MQEEIEVKENTGRSRDAGSWRKLKECTGRNRGKREYSLEQRCRKWKKVKGECRKKEREKYRKEQRCRKLKKMNVECRKKKKMEKRMQEGAEMQEVEEN
jgi:hypothetical protein